MKVNLLSRVQLIGSPWTAAYQAPPSMGFFQARGLECVAIAFSERATRLVQSYSNLDDFNIHLSDPSCPLASLLLDFLSSNDSPFHISH